MQLADEVVAVLTPNEMKTLRKKLAGWTLKTLSQQAKISITQLSQFENGVNGLRQILSDYITNAKWRSIISWLLLVFWLVVSLVGAVAIIGGVRMP